MAKNKKNKNKNRDAASTEETPKKERAKRTWSERVTILSEGVAKKLKRLANMVASGRPPGVPDLTSAVAMVDLVSAQVKTLPADFKPARGSGGGAGRKPAIGSLIQIRDDLDDEQKKYLAELGGAGALNGATITYNDGRYWIVKKADGSGKVSLRKSLCTVVRK